MGAPLPHRRLIARTLDAGFASLSRAGRLSARSRPEAHGLRRSPDIAYGPDPAHRIDVWRPDDDALRPAVLYLHGGAFQHLSKDTHWLMALVFARRGYVVFNADYRLAPRHPYPAALQDAVAARAWVQEHAASWGADPARLVLAGDSAGANLATSLAILGAWRRPEPWATPAFALPAAAAVFAAYGMFQVRGAADLPGRAALPWLIRERIRDVEDCYVGGDCPLADPACLLEAAAPPERPLPPFFLPVGTADPLMTDTARVAAAVHRLGGVADARYYPGELHGFNALIWREQARRSWAEGFDALGRWLPGGPPSPAG